MHLSPAPGAAANLLQGGCVDCAYVLFFSREAGGSYIEQRSVNPGAQSGQSDKMDTSRRGRYPAHRLSPSQRFLDRKSLARHATPALQSAGRSYCIVGPLVCVPSSVAVLCFLPDSPQHYLSDYRTPLLWTEQEHLVTRLTALDGP